MKTTTEHTEDTENAAPAPWHSRWYSAAKRGGLTAVASCLVSEALTFLSAFSGGSPGMSVRFDWLFLLAPLMAAAEKVKAFLAVELNMGQMKEDVELAVRCSRPVATCNRVGGMIPSADEVTEAIVALAR